MNRIFFLLLILIFSQCTSKYNDAIEQVLDDVSSKQVDELKGVLDHYTTPADSLKRKAAYFLVENFPDDKYQTIDKQLLIENIELAFQVWKKPWAKQLSFDEFKELVLPFDLERDSTGTFWRKRFMNEYAFVEDSLKNYPDEHSVFAACKILDKAMSKKYRIVFRTGEPGAIGLNEWEKYKYGDCAGMAFLSNQIMHAVGVPCAVELTPQWANTSYSHYWNVTLVNNHYYPFIFTENTPLKTYKVELDFFSGFIRKRSKVFRKTYAVNHNSLAIITQLPVPSIFTSSHLLDVSQSTIPTTQVQLSVPDSVSQDYLYLSVFSMTILKPAIWGKVDNQSITFDAIRPEAVYILTLFQDNKQLPIGYPFLLKKNGQKHFLKPLLTTKRQITCLKKYPLDPSNMIKIGDSYELFFWDNNKWNTLGQKVATAQQITFSGVPQNALLLLKDVSRGKQERVFTYENNQQIFW